MKHPQVSPAGRFGLFTLAAIVAVLSIAWSAPVGAHGEKAQEAFLRMRSLHWFDTEISPRQGSINDIVTVTGKFRTSKAWPMAIAQPDVAFLNIGVPGPMFVRLESFINDVNMVNSTKFELGATYEYKVVLKARRPGRFHIHPLMNIQDAGPLVGPGVWVDIAGDPAHFKHEVTALTGDVVDLETYGLANVVRWHALWFVIGAAWLVYWLFFKGRLLLPRYRKVAMLGDDADSMITPMDRRFALGLLAATLTITAFGFYWADAKYPVTVPLQTGRVIVPPLPEPDATVDLKLKEAKYEIPGRRLTIQTTITNDTDNGVQVGEFATANVRFINDAVLDIQPIDSHDLVAPSGLRIEGGPIPAGESRAITLIAEDALWETHRLSRLIYDPDSRFAGLVFLYDDQGNRSVVEVEGPMLPTFSM